MTKGNETDREYWARVFGEKFVPMPEKIRQRLEAIMRGENSSPPEESMKRVGSQAPPEEPPEDPSLLTKDQLTAQRMSKAWDKATSRKGRPPIGGAQDD